MFSNPAWTVDITRVLTRRELATVLADAQRAPASLNARRNLIIVRLACCWGLHSLRNLALPARRRERGWHSATHPTPGADDQG